MKGDFTRDTFDPLKHFSRVLMQQGRVTLDADSNEQAAILLRYLRTYIRDMIGPYAGPFEPRGFVLSPDTESGFLRIGAGTYYVDGILAENEEDCLYAATERSSLHPQPDFPVPQDDQFLVDLNSQTHSGEAYWIYLDVWERHVTALEDDAIREAALGGPDTCTRAKVVWQVKSAVFTDDMRRELVTSETDALAKLNALYTQSAQLHKQFEAAAATDTATQISVLRQLQAMEDDLDRANRFLLRPLHEMLLSHLEPISNASLAARVDPGQRVEDACITPPDSKYRGVENHLYRVEIHHGGHAGEATFKWSRDNGSVATSWNDTAGNDLHVSVSRGFEPGDWVELSDDTAELLGLPGTMVKLAQVQPGILSVDPAMTVPPRGNFPHNPKVRRWNQVQTEAVALHDGAIPVQEPAGTPTGSTLWLDIEDGIQIQFTAGGEYRTGDYWLIPARVTTGAIEWPADDTGLAKAQPPAGIRHQYAVLGLVTWSESQLNVENIRFSFSPISFGDNFSGASAAFITNRINIFTRLSEIAGPAGAKPKITKKKGATSPPPKSPRPTSKS